MNIRSYVSILSCVFIVWRLINSRHNATLLLLHAELATEKLYHLLPSSRPGNQQINCDELLFSYVTHRYYLVIWHKQQLKYKGWRKKSESTKECRALWGKVIKHPSCRPWRYPYVSRKAATGDNLPICFLLRLCLRIGYFSFVPSPPFCQFSFPSPMSSYSTSYRLSITWFFCSSILPVLSSCTSFIFHFSFVFFPLLLRPLCLHLVLSIFPLSSQSQSASLPDVQ
jgi:hypothetical protein